MAKSRKEIRNFTIKTLLPYKKDMTKCAMLGGTSVCVYLAYNGNKCAVGRWLKKGEWQEFRGGVINLKGYLERELGKKFEDILLKEAREVYYSLNKDIKFFSLLQDYHDHLSHQNYSKVDSIVDKLEDYLELDLTELKID